MIRPAGWVGMVAPIAPDAFQVCSRCRNRVSARDYVERNRSTGSGFDGSSGAKGFKAEKPMTIKITNTNMNTIGSNGPVGWNRPQV